MRLLTQQAPPPPRRRLLGCASFVELHLVAKHRLAEVPGRAWRPAEPLQVGLAASSWPPEVRELYEGKAALPLPEWAAALEGKMPQLVACMKAALGVQQCVARSLVPPEEVALPEAAKAASKPVASKTPGAGAGAVTCPAGGGWFCRLVCHLCPRGWSAGQHVHGRLACQDMPRMRPWHAHMQPAQGSCCRHVPDVHTCPLLQAPRAGPAARSQRPRLLPPGPPPTLSRRSS